MAGQRHSMLDAIRGALGSTADDGTRQQAVETRIANRRRGPVPARTKGDAATLTALFSSKAIEAAATVTTVASLEEVPQAIARYLRDNNLPSTLRLDPDPALEALPWDRAPMLETSAGPSDGSHDNAVTFCEAGIAETGTLMLASGERHASGLAFLPETHVVVIRKSQIVGGLEDAWDALRTSRGADWPRAVHFVTGPSRSADIEQTLQMGAHGPKRLHIVLVDG